MITKIDILNPKLRWPISKEICKVAKNQKISGLARRAKYLLFELPEVYLCSHLGMTGTWRVFADDRRKHDHIDIHLADGRRLTYQDPRKFGSFEYFKKNEDFHRFQHLGPEPLSDDFDLDYIWMKSRHKEVAVKNFIMDQKIVVGVGNIYAMESLFLGGIRPTRKTKKVTRSEWGRLLPLIKTTLQLAIDAGGSTISDFKKAGGDSGYFQHEFKVYGRDGDQCYQCSSVLKNTTIGGRSSVWCPQCQK